jgi:hypothetical protein
VETDALNLNSQLEKYGDGSGQLHYAVKIVATMFDIPVNSDFLERYSITKTSSIADDGKSLQNLGFPKDYLQQRVTYLPRRHINYLLITAASFIVQSWRTRKQASVAPQPSVPADSPPQKIQSFVELGLVLKGKNLGNIKKSETISLKEVEKALAESDYFFCTSQQNMSDIRKGMNLNKEVDRDAEQQVLVIVCFKSELEEGKTFANKLELNQFLQKGSPSFMVKSIDTLVKVSGLTKSGFVRS